MRDWWLRTLLVLQRPRPVFVALRDDSKESLADRAEPVLAIVLLAGIAIVLSTSTAGHLIDDASYDGLLLAVWAFIAGGLYGVFGYFAFGALLYGGVKLLGSQGTYRRARHVLAFAAVPIALSLVLWPVKLAVYGDDALPDRRQRPRGRGQGLRRVRRRLPAVVGSAARDRRARRARLDVGARRRRVRPRDRRARRPDAGSRLEFLARARTSASASSKSASSSSEIAYVCCSSGNAPVRTSAAYRATASRIEGARSGVLLHEARRVAVVQAEQVVPDEHLAVAVGAGADPDRRDVERLA